eukprot:Gb_23895 [translate_table: standard]
MQHVRATVLKSIRLKFATHHQLFPKDGRIRRFSQEVSQASLENLGRLTDRVLGLVKNLDKIDSSKVTVTADFQKDLCLDSLDRVELVMAFEQEFAIEIPDEKADKISCCADAINYIASQPGYNTGSS